MPIDNNILNKSKTLYDDDFRKELLSGDILLASGEYPFSKLIRMGTKSLWSHCALVVRLDSIDRIIVLESVEDAGLRAVPLSSYVNDYEGTGKGYNGKLVIARNTAVTTKLAERPDEIKEITRFAVDYLGHPYAKDEIAIIAAKVLSGKIGADLAKEFINPKQGAYICSEFVAACMSKISSTIPNYQGYDFVTPDDVAHFCDKAIARIA